MLSSSDAGPSLPKYYGKYPGVVLHDRPTSGAHLGKVKVRVPAILEEDEEGRPRPIEVVARPCLPPGFFFVPEVGDHVWIEFAAGDVNTPIWVGVWYPDDRTPQDADDNAPTENQSVIRTKAGHVVVLDDDAEKIVVKDKHGNQVTLEQGKVTVTVQEGGEIKLGNEASALLTDAQLVRQYLQTHTHLGNMGAPTGPPLLAQVPITELETWFTQTTKAE